MNLELINDIQNKKEHQDSKWLFVSLGFNKRKAHVFKLKNNQYVISAVKKEVRKFERNGFTVISVKVDVITETQEVPFTNYHDEAVATRRNYIDYGISYDKDFTLSFLPEEINANAFIRPIPGKKHNELFMCERNINNYLRKYKGYNKIYFHKKYHNKSVYTFKTQGYFISEDAVVELHSEGYKHGIRKVAKKHLKKEIQNMVSTATEYLEHQIQENGRYEYGKFPHFDKNIGFYNVLRHISSTYSLIEGIEFLGWDEYTESVKKSLDYIIENHTYIDPNDEACCYIFDDTKDVNEIKLGQQGVMLIALCKYMEYTGDESYLDLARKIAKATLNFISDEGDTVHVLDYPSLNLKEENRVIYYDGEAAFGLMKLYQNDKDERWLEGVENLFKQFISQEYHKYSDHWLSYCTYELTREVPKKEYFDFGLKNLYKRMNYIYQRETTFPTFLELLMAGYRMIDNLEKEDFADEFEYDKEALNQTIIQRAEHQRTGYFYPEVAMYFKNPESISGSFFIKHHGYRVRIDDIQHYISGYIQYSNYFDDTKTH